MKLNISARNLETDDKMLEYVEEKIGDLDKYIPRKLRDGVAVDIMLMLDVSGREDNQYVCEVIMNVSNGPLVSKEATMNIYAAIDIVEAKLKAQLAKYKAKHAQVNHRDRLARRLLGEHDGLIAEDAEATDDLSEG